MTRLRQRDLTAFSQALTTLHADVSAETLSERILASVRGLFDCDFATFSLLDLRRGRFHAHAYAPFVVDLPNVQIRESHLHTDPAATYIRKTRKPHAVKVSDFVSLREYRNLSIYTEVFGRVKCDRRLGFAVQAGGPVSLVATLNRKGMDFSEEDRALLDLLRPHLLQANAHANADTQLRAEHVRAQARVSNALGAGLGEIDPDGRFLWLTPRAEALLKTFFPGALAHGACKRLPLALAKRLSPALRRGVASSSPHEALKPSRLIWNFTGPNARVLRVRLISKPRSTGWQLLLEEITAATPPRLLAHALHLTTREAEVLHWLKQGKTNWEIGRILDVAEKTVGKHLENIYLKLNVGNRASAIRAVTEASAGFEPSGL